MLMTRLLHKCSMITTFYRTADRVLHHHTLGILLFEINGLVRTILLTQLVHSLLSYPAKLRQQLGWFSFNQSSRHIHSVL